ncbi:MAG: lysophospholipid acyltransferase family protein [Roseobacter sp.]
MAKQIPNYLNPFITVFHLAITRLPFKTASSLMAFVLANSGRTLTKSGNMRKNIREVFPDLEEPAVEELTKKMLANFGRHIAEILHIASFKKGKRGLCIDFSTPEGATFDGKGPAIYVGAHVGSWEFLPLVFNQKNQPITVIYSQHDNSVVNNLLMQQRRQMGANYVEKNKALRPCFEALNRGEAVALLVDQRVNPGIDVDFFGRPTAISRIPAGLAASFNCPIVPFEVVRIKPGHLRVVFQEAIVPDGKKDKQAQLKVTQEIANSLQESIIRNADTWFCSKLRWKRVDKEKIRAQRCGQANANQSQQGQ